MRTFFNLKAIRETKSRLALFYQPKTNHDYLYYSYLHIIFPYFVRHILLHHSRKYVSFTSSSNSTCFSS